MLYIDLLCLPQHKSQVLDFLRSRYATMCQAYQASLESATRVLQQLSNFVISSNHPSIQPPDSPMPDNHHPTTSETGAMSEAAKKSQLSTEEQTHHSENIKSDHGTDKHY